MIIKPIFAGILETALNQYLALDEDVELFLAPLSGKVIAVTIEPYGETLYLCPSEHIIQVLESYQGRIDTTISGTLPALGMMSLDASSIRSVFSGEVRIEGDTHTGHKFQRLFQQLDIDLEEQLSRFTGDIIAHKIGNLFRSGRDWSKQTLETFRLNLEEFLQEETRQLPAKAEADIFFRQVDELRSDYDRLEARLERLQTKQKQQNET
ncbi:ubiquinone biosynthesis accessory factor UbiJ [Methylomarinum vadi]|uniref:ubiquinone biosynthesis accessory factor UbiJ n=1 Tax=Methylomarinum vadi TaxID=438855 RepID=UPI0004DF2906|nr:SCP2 sterol-binding domain-containing protein [Methylomarinum vadi]